MHVKNTFKILKETKLIDEKMLFVKISMVGAA